MSRDKILFITLSNIGDVIMTTPVISVLQKKFPDALIDIVADRRSAEIFSNLPCLGETIIKDKNSAFRGSLALIKKLRIKKYDLAVDLRTDGLIYLIRAKKRLSKWGSKPYGPHAVEHHMGVIRNIHGDLIVPDCHIWLNETLEEYAKKKLKNFYNKNILGIGPGAKWPGKIWPQENYLALIEGTKDIFDAVVLLGNKQDIDLSMNIVTNSPLPVVNFCGKTGLLEAASIQKNLTVFVGNDSGLGHIASAVNTPTITIFGQGSPERYRPWGQKAKWLTGKDCDISKVSVNDVINCMEFIDFKHK